MERALILIALLALLVMESESLVSSSLQKCTCEPSPRGHLGPRGPRGDRGEPGREGIQGVEGLPGLVGETGLTGRNPEILAGRPVVYGPRGATGATGPRGATGYCTSCPSSWWEDRDRRSLNYTKIRSRFARSPTFLSPEVEGAAEFQQALEHLKLTYENLRASRSLSDDDKPLALVLQ